jgi:hypothetical protein
MSKLQARLFWKPEIFYNPELVKVLRYWRHPIDEKIENQYQQKLRALVGQDLAKALQKGAFSEDSSEKKPPLARLHDQIQSDVLGVKFSKGPEEQIANLLAKKNVEGAFELIKKTSDLNWKQPVYVSFEGKGSQLVRFPLFEYLVHFKGLMDNLIHLNNFTKFLEMNFDLDNEENLTHFLKIFSVYPKMFTHEIFKIKLKKIESLFLVNEPITSLIIPAGMDNLVCVFR